MPSHKINIFDNYSMGYKKKRIKYIYLTFATPRLVNVSVESLLNLILNIIYIGLRFRQQRAVKT